MHELRRYFGDRVGTTAGSLSQDIVVLTPEEAKGLEFDGVVLIEPAEMASAAHVGMGSLYVALTRATHALHVITSQDMPAGFPEC